MATQRGFGLVHGGLHGGWCWDALRPYLQGPSVAVDLPGRAADEAALGRISYEDWVASATAQINALETPDIVLVGHSLAGITLPQVAIRLAGRVRAIIFVAAVIPVEGMSFEQHMGYPIAGAFWPPPPPEVARALLGTGMSGAMIDHLLGRLNPEPALPLKTPVSRQGVPPVPCLYIRAEADQTGLGAAEAERLRGDFPEVKLLAMAGGHNMMMTHPEVLAAIINEFASALT